MGLNVSLNKILLYLCLGFLILITMLKRSFLLIVLAVSAYGAPALAQDWKSILGNAAKNVIGDKITTAQSIIGTWTYVAPDCKFESDNLLAKAGGEAASAKIEEKLDGVYQKLGMSGCSYTFNDDNTYTFTFKGRKMQGTYSFDAESKVITMKTRLGVTGKAHLAVTGNTMSLLFNADKLMAALKGFTQLTTKAVNSKASVINSLVDNYDGLLLGFELKK